MYTPLAFNAPSDDLRKILHGATKSGRLIQLGSSVDIQQWASASYRWSSSDTVTSVSATLLGSDSEMAPYSDED